MTHQVTMPRQHEAACRNGTDSRLVDKINEPAKDDWTGPPLELRAGIDTII